VGGQLSLSERAGVGRARHVLARLLARVMWRAARMDSAGSQAGSIECGDQASSTLVPLAKLAE
jgi:hypothetical protein